MLSERNNAQKVTYYMTEFILNEKIDKPIVGEYKLVFIKGQQIEEWGKTASWLRDFSLQ